LLGSAPMAVQVPTPAISSERRKKITADPSPKLTFRDKFQTAEGEANLRSLIEKIIWFWGTFILAIVITNHSIRPV
jgi:hypothetical protein